MSEGALITMSPFPYYNGQSESLSTEAMTTVMCEKVIWLCLCTMDYLVLRDWIMIIPVRIYAVFRYATHLSKPRIPIATI